MLSSRTSAQPLWHDERLDESDEDAAIAMLGSAGIAGQSTMSGIDDYWGRYNRETYKVTADNLVEG